VAGDVHDNQYKQAITAAGYGCSTALEVQKWLEDQSHKACSINRVDILRIHEKFTADNSGFNQ